MVRLFSELRNVLVPGSRRSSAAGLAQSAAEPKYMDTIPSTPTNKISMDPSASPRLSPIAPSVRFFS